MKKEIILISLVVYVAMSACHKNELDRKLAGEIIVEQLKYPSPLKFDVLIISPELAKAALDAGLEGKGFVVLQHVQEAKDTGKPFIYFTEKAKPYLIRATKADSLNSVQPVKLADEEFVEVTGIKTSEDGKSAIVTYTTRIRNLTPFTVFLPKGLNASTAKNKVQMSLYDDGWKVEKEYSY